MRLTNIYTKCKQSQYILRRINIKREPNNKYYVQNLDNCKDVEKQLADIKSLKDTYNQFIDCYRKLNSNMKKGTTDDILFLKFEKAKNTLLEEINSLVNLFESCGMKEEAEIGLDIKIPTSGNFSDFRKNIDDLDFVFSKCAFLQSNEETLQFKSVDIGSVWLTFAVVGASLVAGSILMNNIIAFIDKCIITYSHYLTAEEQKLGIEKANKTREEKDELIKYVNKVYKVQVDNAINELEELTGRKIEDGDERGRVEQCFDKLAKLIDKGLEIHSSLSAPEEIKVLFEPLEMKYLSLRNELKSIEQKSNDE